MGQRSIEPVRVLVEVPTTYTDLDGKDWRIEGWGTREEAVAEIEKARERFHSVRPGGA